MRVVFFGTPEFALPTLQALIDRPEFEVMGVLSQPDRPKGRGKKLQPTPVKALAVDNEIPVWQPERLRKSPETLDALRSLEADAFVVVAYGQILKPDVLAMPRLGCINVHGSLLPAYRGAAPIQWAIANGETKTGITTMLMDEGMDTGDMLLKVSVPISDLQTSPDLAAVLAPLGAELLVKTLLELDAGAIAPEPQSEALATYASLLKKHHFCLDWTLPAKQLHDRIRGFYPNCFTGIEGDRLKVLGSQPPGTAISTTTESSPGKVLDIIKNVGFAVGTGSNPLLITKVQPAGKKAQSAWDFANGARLEVGHVLSFDGNR